jgi:DNA-binding response OmpR family regulator
MIIGTHKVLFGEYTLDIDASVLWKNGKKIPLSPREFDVLTYLVTHQGMSVTATTIYNELWKNSNGDCKVVAVYIQRLRKKLEEDPSSAVFITTEYGNGYRFNTPALAMQSQVGNAGAAM